jgi:hypothetical protein
VRCHGVVSLPKCSDRRERGGRPIRRDVAETLHQVSDLNGIDRLHGSLDLVPKRLVRAARDQPVEFLARLLPCERMGEPTSLAR